MVGGVDMPFMFNMPGLSEEMLRKRNGIAWCSLSIDDGSGGHVTSTPTFIYYARTALQTAAAARGTVSI
jgi:hypothetical protein